WEAVLRYFLVREAAAPAITQLLVPPPTRMEIQNLNPWLLTLPFNSRLRVLRFCVFFLLSCHVKISAQCCAGCSPIGGNTNLGTLPKYMLQVNSFYRYAFSSGYMENDHASD